MVAIPQILVVGLGNLPYPLTRHSVGHLIVDSLAERLGLHFTTNRALGGFSAQGNVTIGEEPVALTLLKPKALMNISGKPVVSALRQTVGSPSSMIVIHDSLSHKPGAVSPKFGGSANGHNGVRSIISALGNDMGFHRLRIGIGRTDGDVAEYVLGKLSSHEKSLWGADGQGIDMVWRELEKITRVVLRPR